MGPRNADVVTVKLPVDYRERLVDAGRRPLGEMETSQRVSHRLPRHSPGETTQVTAARGRNVSGRGSLLAFAVALFVVLRRTRSTTTQGACRFTVMGREPMSFRSPSA